jgi:hypothetical protein
LNRQGYSDIKTDVVVDSVRQLIHGMSLNMKGVYLLNEFKEEMVSRVVRLDNDKSDTIFHLS